MPNNTLKSIENLVRKAPHDWLVSVCDALLGFPASATTEYVIQHLPLTNNADLAFIAKSAVNNASGTMSWEALSWALLSAYTSYQRCRAEFHTELLWSGPSPANQIPARRIDQALYDQISKAKEEILLVTFAAAKIERLVGVLLESISRGVKVRLILEFEGASEGQLSFDALRAFPHALISKAEVYFWPVEKRVRNQAGRPGKLHAKLAIVDGAVLVSSANLTDDAFNRNLEVGILITSQPFHSTVSAYIDALISDRIIVSVAESK